MDQSYGTVLNYCAEFLKNWFYLDVFVNDEPVCITFSYKTNKQKNVTYS